MTTTYTTLDSYLREQTSSIHELTEKALEPLGIFTDLTIENYGIFIQIQYRWHHALEAILTASNTSLIFNGYIYTPKTPLLTKDIEALGINPSVTETRITKELAIPGIIYVLEGSMLGGTVISKHLETEGIALEYRQYFSHCAATAKHLWPITRKYLREIENTGNRFDLCLDTSNFCFQLMINIAREEIALSGLHK